MVTACLIFVQVVGIIEIAVAQESSDNIEIEEALSGFDDGNSVTEDALTGFDENNNRHIHNSDDDKGFEISDKDTMIVVRGGVNARDQWKDLVSSLERSGYCLSSIKGYSVNRFTCIMSHREIGL